MPLARSPRRALVGPRPIDTRSENAKLRTGRATKLVAALNDAFLGATPFTALCDRVGVLPVSRV